MLQSGATRLRFLRWKQRLEPLPWRVGAFFAFHTGECTPPARVCKHALVPVKIWPPWILMPTPCTAATVLVLNVYNSGIMA